MGKVMEKIKLMSLFDRTRKVEVEAVIDTGAAMLVLPRDLVKKLKLKKIREVTVKYANNKTEKKLVYSGLLIELKGRVGEFEALAEEEGSQPLIGQVVLESLDLIVEPRTRKLSPNPRSPNMPMVEIL